uniref:Uncharacterized protein n=1 Tax=Kryptolebias marmoratus TaxID=37003 RepID=A0A3Q3BHY3_KRYMA
GDLMSGHRFCSQLGRVHSELEGVQFAQFGQGTSQVIDLGHGISNSAHDGGSMLLHLRRVRAQIGPVREVGLGLGVSNQNFQTFSIILEIKVAPPCPQIIFFIIYLTFKKLSLYQTF